MSTRVKKPDVLPKSALIRLSAQHDLPRPTEAFWQASDGASLRYAHWQTSASPRQGNVLFLNGRTEFIEKTIETYGVLVRSGLDLWTLDWRGQGLSERSLSDRQKGHIEDYQTYLDDLDQFVREVTDLPTCAGKRLMLAHSMGAHLGLRYLHDHPGLIDAAVLLAPMIDIPVNRAAIRGLNRVIHKLGFGEAFAPGTGRFKPLFNNPADPDDNGTLDDYRALMPSYEGLSRDPEKRAEVERHVRDNNALALGGPTSAWLKATCHSINITLRPGYAEAIDTPVLIINGGRDRVVVEAQQKRMAARLPKAAFQSIEEGGHELLMERASIRQAVLEAFAAWTGVEIQAAPARSISP